MPIIHTDKCYRPLTADADDLDILAHDYRVSITQAVARKLSDQHYDSSERQAIYNRVFTLASTTYGIKVTSSETPRHCRSVNDQSIKDALSTAFYKQYRFFEIFYYIIEHHPPVAEDRTKSSLQLFNAWLAKKYFTLDPGGALPSEVEYMDELLATIDPKTATAINSDTLTDTVNSFTHYFCFDIASTLKFVKSFLTPEQLLAYLGKIKKGKLDYLISGHERLAKVLEVFPIEYRCAVLATLGLDFVCAKIKIPASESALKLLPKHQFSEVSTLVLRKISLPELYLNMYGLGFLLMLATGWIRLIAKLLYSNNIVTEETANNATLLSLTGTAVFYCYKNYQIWATRNLEFPKEFAEVPESSQRLQIICQP